MGEGEVGHKMGVTEFEPSDQRKGKIYFSYTFLSIILFFIDELGWNPCITRVE